MIDRLRGLPLLADLSHCICGQEMTLPITAVNQQMVERILRHAQGFHGRVASAEQVQIEIGFPCHKPWVDQFLTWWGAGFRDWLGRAAPADTLTFTVELGPKPYAISGPDGNDLSNRWEDALQIRQMVLDLWADVSRPALAS